MRQNYDRATTALAALLLAVGMLAEHGQAQNERYRYRFGGENHGVLFVSPTQGIATRDGGGILFSADSGQTWEEAEVPLNVRRQLRHVFALDESNVWAVGSGGVVLKSSNRGENWSLLNESSPVLDRRGNPAALYDIWMHSTLDGIVCGEVGTLAVTSDGGVTWSSVTLPTNFFDPTANPPQTPGDIYRFHFFDAQDGFVTCDKGRWMTTDDAGATWVLGVPPFSHYCGFDPDGDLELWGVDFDGDEGWIVGGNGTNNAHTFYTTNRGSTWTHIDYVVPLDAGALAALTSTSTGGWPTFYGVEALGNGEAVAVSYAAGVFEFSAAGSMSALAVDRCAHTGPLVTSDDPTWFQTAAPSYTGPGIGPGRPPLTTVFALSPQQRWLVGRFGTIQQWDDSSSTWITRGTPTAYQHRFTHADFMDGQVGLITGQGHRILKTVDGAQSFTEVHVGSDAGEFMERVALSRHPTSGLALASGSSGFMARSTNSGDTWSYVQPPHIQSLDLRFAGTTNTVYAAGPAGYVFRTDASVVDGIFLDWINVSLPEQDHAVNGLAFVDEDTGFAVTSGMKAWLTTNGGASWNAVGLLGGPASTQPLHAVATYGDASNAVAVGAAGTVLVRTGGRFQGVDLSPLVGSTPLTAVQIIDGGTKIVVGGNDGMVVEFVGQSFADALDPLNWTAPKSMTSERIVAVCFDADDHGFLIGQQGWVVEFD